MKLREFSDDKAELIYYMRSNETGPTVGVFGQVRKTGHVFWAGRTRIHLDDVDGLGPYLELEVVLEPDEPTESGIKEAESLMELLEINKDSLVSEAYVDLLNRSDRPNRK
jgi:adenylate cyclase class IV